MQSESRAAAQRTQPGHLDAEGRLGGAKRGDTGPHEAQLVAGKVVEQREMRRDMVEGRGEMPLAQRIEPGLVFGMEREAEDEG